MQNAHPHVRVPKVQSYEPRPQPAHRAGTQASIKKAVKIFPSFSNEIVSAIGIFLEQLL